MLDATLAVMERYGAGSLPVAFDEWNTYVGAKPPDYIEDYTLADALYTGALMNACLQRADRIKYSAIYHLTNVMGSPMWPRLCTNGRSSSWGGAAAGCRSRRAKIRLEPAVIKMPATLVLELMTQHRGADAVQL